MRRGGELYIGRKSMGNEVTPLFKNEANQPMPHVLAFNKVYLGSN